MVFVLWSYWIAGSSQHTPGTPHRMGASRMGRDWHKQCHGRRYSLPHTDEVGTTEEILVVLIPGKAQRKYWVPGDRGPSHLWSSATLLKGQILHEEKVSASKAKVGEGR